MYNKIPNYEYEYDKRNELIYNRILLNFNRPSLWLVNGIISILSCFSIELLEVIEKQMFIIRAIPEPLEQFKSLLSFIDKRINAKEWGEK